ncbi:right-handed parallel beta-helix repeat-containing protein, partial [Klebsiella pneumoniae]|nr:right-handed parallel beta-helix repeat-containing protein [Klebsiella pneumoniae]
MAFNPELGSTSPAVLLDNAERLDKLVNGDAATEPDRAGVDLDTWRGMMAKNDQIRQNLVPLSKQYMTLEAAQADIANIPEGSTTYYRSPDDSALAIEVMNVGGTLTATGRTMASGELVAKIDNRISESEGENIVEIHDSEKNIVGLLDKDGYFFLPYLPESVQNTINRLLSLVSSRSGSDIFRLGDGENDTFIQDCDGRV